MRTWKLTNELELVPTLAPWWKLTPELNELDGEGGGDSRADSGFVAGCAGRLGRDGR
jgi:hypothetical protein